MMNMIRTLTATVVLMASATSLSLAEDAHHPPGGPIQQVVPGTPPSAGLGTPNMPGPQMTTPNSAPMMGMTGQVGMRMPDMSMHGMDMPGMATVDHVEGRIAFLHTELKISDAQAKVWHDFAQALRENAKRLANIRTTAAKLAGSAPTLAQRLENQERWLTARLDGNRVIRMTFVQLYDALSADQKKTADELLGAHMGLMSSAMMSMGGNVR